MMTYHHMHSTRRSWLSTCFSMSVWPEVLAAQQHAHSAAGAGSPHFETLDAHTAAEIEALAAQILPSTGGPGARETGVVYFIDRALGTFASEEREIYRVGMAEFQAKRKELFPQSTSIVSLSDQRDRRCVVACRRPAILHRPPYLIAGGPKDDSPVNSRKLSIYWVSVKVAPRISCNLHGQSCESGLMHRVEFRRRHCDQRSPM